MFKKEKRYTQEFYPYEGILDNGLIKVKDGYLKILKVSPINYELKSSLEKESVLNSYKLFLKTCNFNFQILIQSKKEDLSNYITNIKNNIEENENLHELCKDYLLYIENIRRENKSSLKEFFIILKYKVLDNDKDTFDIAQNNLSDDFFKIKETLSRCGNVVQVISNRIDVKKFLEEFYN